MLKVEEAQSIVLEHARPLPARVLPLSVRLLGLALAEDIVSDLDMPPYDKALMDGVALRAQDSGIELTLIEEVMAGQVPTRAVGPGQATSIMTGAPLPAGADAVVMIERCALLDGNRVRVDGDVRPGQNILPRGREMRKGEKVLSLNCPLGPQELGLLATVGRADVSVYPPPEVAVVATGDEIVSPSEMPGPGQIRNSNGLMLQGQVARAGALPRSLGIARDEPSRLRESIAEGLHSDVLILSGGVSAGKLDLVSEALTSLGVQTHFHKVAMKPGKPVLFGTKANDSGPPRLVFGLPGNPVSALVCFELFVRPALRRLMALDPGGRMIQATLVEDYAYRTDRPTYHPARLERATVRPVPWFGSPDLRGLSAANAFVVFPEGDHRHRAGQTFPVLRVEND